jgi:hypothetical protein
VNSGLLPIKTFSFKRECLEQTYEFLAQAGRKRFEAVGLFAGHIEGQVAYISEAILPLQKSYKLEAGLLYVVEGDELHRINVMLYKNNLRLIAQIHTHPQRAYHSETDDEYPIMSTIGGLSIVVPYFASAPLDIKDWAYYRLLSAGTWQEVSENEIKTLIKVQ